MKKIITILFICFSFFTKAQIFPSIDSAKTYTLKWVKTDPLSAFSNYKLQKLLYGTLEKVDSVRGAIGGSSTTLYNGDGTIPANRVVNVNNKTLTFSNPSRFKINDGSGNNWFDYNQASKTIYLGDNDVSNNGNFISVDDANSLIQLNAANLKFNNVTSGSYSSDTFLVVTNSTKNIFRINKSAFFVALMKYTDTATMLSGYLQKGDNLASLTSASTARTNLGLSTTANLSASTNKNFVTDAQLTVIGNTSGTNTGDQTAVSGNAGTATALQTARNINGVAFNGSADITVTAAAGTLTGDTLNSTVTASSLTSFGTSPTIVTPSFTTGFTIGGAAVSGNTIIGDGTNFVAQNTRENWTTFVVSGSNATTTGQSLTDITGLVSGTLSNSTLYEVEAWLYVSTSAVTTGTQYGIQTGGTGSAGVVSALMQGTTTTNAVAQVTLSAPNAAQGTFLTTSSASGVIWIHGFVTTRSTGTAKISIQHLKVTSGTSTVKIGSKLKIRLAN